MITESHFQMTFSLSSTSCLLKLPNVSKGNMCTMEATIGLREEDLFKPYTMEIRNCHVKVDNFMNSLPCSMSEKNKHARKLEFLA